MNDEALVELVEQNAAEDLTVEQLTEIRARIPESPSLCNALHDRLEIEQQIAGTVGGCNVPVAAILSQISTLASTATVGTTAWTIWGWKAGLSLLVAVSVSVYTLVAILDQEKKPQEIEKPNVEKTQPVIKTEKQPIQPMIPFEDEDESEPSPSDMLDPVEDDQEKNKQDLQAEPKNQDR